MGSNPTVSARFIAKITELIPNMINLLESPKFSVDSLVTFDSTIFEIKETITASNGYSYKVRSKAYLRDPSDLEWRNQLVSNEEIISESQLKSFDHPKPKYELGERVKLLYFNCFVRFIKFENYHYMYYVMDESREGSGWIKEEDYLSR